MTQYTKNLYLVDELWVDPNKVDGVCDEHLLDSQVKRGVDIEGGGVVDLYQPRPQSVVQHDIIAKHLRSGKGEW
jgi:hypothetical protein